MIKIICDITGKEESFATIQDFQAAINELSGNHTAFPALHHQLGKLGKSVLMEEMDRLTSVLETHLRETESKLEDMIKDEVGGTTPDLIVVDGVDPRAESVKH